MEIKILDCTLREGGYINNWDFKENNIKCILENLTLASCDYIECGFLKKDDYQKDKTFFQNFQQLESLLPENCNNTEFCLMINYGEFPIENIPDCNTKINLRVVFKKEKYLEAIEYCKQLILKGYKIFINPMNSNTYSNEEFLNLIKLVNKINPVGFTIVDTTGSMSKKEVLSLFQLVENNLDKNIALCFHSHNNLQLSFSNAQTLMEQNTKRMIIIDSTVMGIGRGAGNLCTELLVEHLNAKYNKNYKQNLILKIIDEYISKIYSVTPWGYSVPYYITAKNNCHPNYAKYLIDNKIKSIETIIEILNSIPNKNRGSYNKDIIESLCKKTKVKQL